MQTTTSRRCLPAPAPHWHPMALPSPGPAAWRCCYCGCDSTRFGDTVTVTIACQQAWGGSPAGTASAGVGPAGTRPSCAAARPATAMPLATGHSSKDG